MEQGWVYVLVNSSIPGMAKVGRTTRSPAERAAELSGATGVATPFVLAFDQAFEDCCAAEDAVHGELDRRGWRVAANREFFRGSPSDIIRIILDVGGGLPDGSSARDGGTAGALLAAGDQAYFGLGESLQDTGEALRLFKLAASRGSLIAYERLGRIYHALYTERRDPVARRRLMAPLKEGARRGNYYCFAEMAAAFACDNHRANFQKAWELFFSRRRDCRRDELEVDDLEGDGQRFTTACCRYIALCIELRLAPEHRQELAEVAESLVAALLTAIDEARDDAADRQRVAGVLRWVYQSLLPRPATIRELRKHSFGRLQRYLLPQRAVAPA